jgi:hypothetical protein
VGESIGQAQRISRERRQNFPHMPCRFLSCVSYLTQGKQIAPLRSALLQSRRCVVLKVLYVAASVVSVALLANPAAAFQPVRLVNSQTQMCLQPAGGSTAQGAAIVEEPCNVSAPIQIWLVIPVENAGTHFENALTQFCLDARGKAEAGTPVQQWTCNQITNENWDPTVGPPNLGGLVESRVSGSDSFCLAGQQTAGVGMQILRCNSGAVSQRWQLKPSAVTVVPKVTNSTEDVAAATLQFFDLKEGTVTPKGCGGTVLKQAGPPGAEAILQWGINLTVTCP